MMRMTLSLEAKILMAFIAWGLVLLGAGWFAVSSGRAYLASDARVDRLHETERALMALQISLRSAESGQRGFLITGRPEYLRPYLTTRGDIDRELDETLNLIADQAEVLSMFREISGDVRRLLAQLHEAIEAREKDGFGAARRVVETDLGQNEMLRLRAQIEAIQRTLRAEITREVSRSKLRSTHTLEAAGIVGGLVLALAFAAYHLLAWDLRQRRWLAGELARQANHDSLTQLPNRRMFEEWLGYALAQARRDDTHLAVMFIDIDGFKAVNDRHGHKAGDALLVEIAKRFRGTGRESDFLARVGGDEFALIAPNAKDGRALAVLAQRLIRVLNDPQRPPLSDVPVGASIGIAFFPDDAADVRSLVGAADEAMYAAKRSGKGRIAFHATAVAPVAAISPLAAVA